jgi:PKD repeat protein
LSYYGNVNPFKNLQTDLKSKLDFIKKSMPIYIQYYYDFLDDLAKAYHEFKERSFEVITECCPDEDLFPMHLMLGEATVNTVDYIRSPFRQYFISSPLFNNQADLLNEVKLLFDRMVNLVKNLFIPQFNARQGIPIRITPSKWSYSPLSARSIPYYYNINNVARSWNPLKTRKGKSNFNLSYNADKYTTPPPDIILNPLQYSIEPFDFYRIEGHIGQEFSSVLNVILSARNSNRLPFDVIALKAGTDAADTTIKYDCHFEDLEAQFKFIRAELACKMHEPLCIAAKVPSILRFNVAGANTSFSFLETFSAVHTLALQDVVAQKNLILTNFVQTVRFTRKGDFLKTYCPVKEGTLGYEYVQSINKFFPRPTQIDLTTTSGAKAALMHLIDITEALMQTITGASTIYNFKYDNFNRIYDDMISYFTDFMQAVLNADGQERRLSPLLYGMLEAVVTCCIDEKLKALMDEYIKRVEKIQKQNLLSEYLQNNPGVDHKAGVPRGGTFIIVYHEAPPNTATLAATANTLTSVAAIDSIAAVTDTNTKKLAETSAISKENLSKILRLFDSNELQLSTAQAKALKDLTLQRFAGAAIRDLFVIPDKAVVADFYLPYLCCSDCPPVAYILPKQQQDALSLKLDKTDFCNNDDNVYKIAIGPQGGTLTASAGGVDTEKLEFRPKGLAAGINKITYTLPDNRSTSIDLKITAAFEVDFKPEPIATDPFSIHFIPVNTENKTVSWNFGDGTGLSTEQSPIHQFILTTDPQTFVVSLTVTAGPCVIKREHEIKLTKPQQQVFLIDPTVFCSNDEQPHVFTINPAVGNVNDIQNQNGLKLETDANGNVFFVAAKQGVLQTTDYHLNYKGVSVDIKITAIFETQITAEPVSSNPLARKFTASNSAGKPVEWNFGDGSTPSTENSPVHAFNITDNQQTFQVSVLVIDGPCRVAGNASVTISKPTPDAFSIEPKVFCAGDKTKKIFTTTPPVNNVSEIKNPDNLLLEKGTDGSVFFVPAKQDISQTKEYALTYHDISSKIKIIVPDAGFTMKLDHNTSPVAVFPTFLSLKAKEANADKYNWSIANAAGVSLKFSTKDVDNINLAQLNIPGSQSLRIIIDLTISFENQTNVNCAATKNYVITTDIFSNHLNKGEFDNLTSS